MRTVSLVLLSLLVVGCAGPRPSAPPAAPTASPQAVTTASPPARSYALRCGPMPVAECEERANGIVARAEQAHPGRTVVSIEFSAADGDYELLFDDGTGIGADVN
jgi:hypothetical protein